MSASTPKRVLLTRLIQRLYELDEGILVTNQPDELRARLTKRIADLRAQGVRPAGEQAAAPMGIYPKTELDDAA